MLEYSAADHGYHFLPGVAQYSAGVISAPGYRITRVQFGAAVALGEGLRQAARIIEAAGRPPGSLCACELRSPEPFSEEAFAAFNRHYLAELKAIGVVVPGGLNPVARTNVCPARSKPAEPSLHAFCFTEPGGTDETNFVVSGSAEAPEGHNNYRDHIAAYRDVTGTGLHIKARFVVAELTRRMTGLGLGEAAPQVVQVYSVHDVSAPIADEVLAPMGVPHGVTWHHARPPVADLEFEMDCRTVSNERVNASR